MKNCPVCGEALIPATVTAADVPLAEVWYCERCKVASKR